MTLAPHLPPSVDPRLVKVAIIDDDLIARSFIAQMVSELGFDVVGQAEDGDQAMNLVRDCNPDVLIMDIRMQRVDGIEATRLIKEAGLKVGIITLTSFDTEQAILDAAAAGVDGFLAKDAVFRDYLSAIIEVYRGNGALSPRASKVLLEQSQRLAPEPAALQLEADRVRKLLTPAEYQTVEELVRTGGTNKEIADATHRSESHIKQLLGSANDKLGVDSRTKLVIYLLRAGIGLQGSDIHG